MKTFNIWVPKPGVIYETTKLSDFEPTPYTLQMPTYFTKNNFVPYLKSIGILDSQAEVTYKVKWADTGHWIYIWKDITFFQAINSITNENSKNPPPYSQPITGGGVTPNIPTINYQDNIRTSKNYPAAFGYSAGTTPTQVPHLLALFILQNFVSVSPPINQKQLQSDTAYGLTPQMVPVLYTNSTDQLANIRSGNTQNNINYVPGYNGNIPYNTKPGMNQNNNRYPGNRFETGNFKVNGVPYNVFMKQFKKGKPY